MPMTLVQYELWLWTEIIRTISVALIDGEILNSYKLTQAARLILVYTVIALRFTLEGQADSFA